MEVEAMKYSIVFSDEMGLVTVKTTGSMNAHDFIGMAEDILRYPNYAPGTDVFFDHEDLDLSDVMPEELEAIRAFHRDNESRIGGGRSAMLLRPGLSGKWHGLWSQGSKLKTANQARVFENRDEAVRWAMTGDSGAAADGLFGSAK
jgi:hypothetical protein